MKKQTVRPILSAAGMFLAMALTAYGGTGQMG